MNKSKLLAARFGGKWRYTGFGGGWFCDDGVRFVVKVCVLCGDEPCGSMYVMYDGNEIPKYIDWYILASEVSK